MGSQFFPRAVLTNWAWQQPPCSTCLEIRCPKPMWWQLIQAALCRPESPREIVTICFPSALAPASHLAPGPPRVSLFLGCSAALYGAWLLLVSQANFPSAFRFSPTTPCTCSTQSTKWHFACSLSQWFSNVFSYLHFKKVKAKIHYIVSHPLNCYETIPKNKITLYYK